MLCVAFQKKRQFHKDSPDKEKGESSGFFYGLVELDFFLSRFFLYDFYAKDTYFRKRRKSGWLGEWRCEPFLRRYTAFAGFYFIMCKNLKIGVFFLRRIEEQSVRCRQPRASRSEVLGSCPVRSSGPCISSCLVERFKLIWEG